MRCAPGVVVRVVDDAEAAERDVRAAHDPDAVQRHARAPGRPEEDLRAVRLRAGVDPLASVRASEHDHDRAGPRDRVGLVERAAWVRARARARVGAVRADVARGGRRRGDCEGRERESGKDDRAAKQRRGADRANDRGTVPGLPVGGRTRPIRKRVPSIAVQVYAHAACPLRPPTRPYGSTCSAAPSTS